MADEKKEPWLNYLALTTVILAVCATLSTFKGGSYSTRSVLSQSQAADQWAFYQSKSLKGYLYEVEKDDLELQLLREKDPAVARACRDLIAEYSAQIARYDEEKKTITGDARRFESIRDDARKHANTFGMAVIFLQIAILLSSVAALLKRKPLWILGLVSGAAGLVYFVNGFFLLKL